MDIVFQNASNGELSCSRNNVRIHSYYNPSKEAQRFAFTLNCPFTPSFIIITEPAISYCASFFRERFPESKLCCIRYSDSFTEYDKQWDKVFNGHSEFLSEDLFNYMGEEGISKCLFASWKASEQAYPDVSGKVWNGIKETVLKSRSVLSTRDYFAKRWTKNALRFATLAKTTAIIKKGNSNVLVCASGPSLLSSIPKIKQYRKSFFLIAVSSALSPLVKNGIIPDLCISTDGGFWAKLHISFSLKSTQIPLALPGEGSCFASVMENATLIPLLYGDGTSEEIISRSGIQGQKAIRNGSVSGTAVYFALSLTSAPVYCCGLDLDFSKGFVHTQPNELETNDSIYDFRLRTTETRISKNILNKNSINIYRSWFSSQDFCGRVYRLSDNYPYSNTLGKIKDIDWDNYENMSSLAGSNKPEMSKTDIKNNYEDRKVNLKKICQENIDNREWIHNAVPSDSVVMERSKGTQNYNRACIEVKEKMNLFVKDIMRAIER